MTDSRKWYRSSMNRWSLCWPWRPIPSALISQRKSSAEIRFVSTVWRQWGNSVCFVVWDRSFSSVYQLHQSVLTFLCLDFVSEIPEAWWVIETGLEESMGCKADESLWDPGQNQSLVACVVVRVIGLEIWCLNDWALCPWKNTREVTLGMTWLIMSSCPKSICQSVWWKWPCVWEGVVNGEFKSTTSKSPDICCLLPEQTYRLFTILGSQLINWIFFAFMYSDFERTFENA